MYTNRQEKHTKMPVEKTVLARKVTILQSIRNEKTVCLIAPKRGNTNASNYKNEKRIWNYFLNAMQCLIQLEEMQWSGIEWKQHITQWLWKSLSKMHVGWSLWKYWPPDLEQKQVIFIMSIPWILSIPNPELPNGVFRSDYNLHCAWLWIVLQKLEV